jgi:NTP pyrophosphatase (non-canonical NTP hydrolase)
MVSIEEYQRFVKQVQKKFKDPKDALAVWGLGLSGEAGDAAGCIKKTLFHDNDQTLGIKENLGDCLWYIAAICNHQGWTLEELMKENVDKLKSRYPKGRFMEKDARRNGERIDWNEKE